MGYYADGKIDCEVKACPLYPFMPYRSMQPEKDKTASPEQREKFVLLMKNAREKHTAGDIKTTDGTNTKG